jgi:glycosyltransferase involved in cell wall biosynthesis
VVKHLSGAKRRLRVAQILTNLHDGGIEKLVRQIALGLPSDQFEVRVFALIDRNPWLEHFQSEGIDVMVIGARNCLAIRSVLPNIRAVFRLARELRRWGCDLANVHDFFPGILGRVAAWLARVPSVVSTLHNTYSWFGSGPHAMNRLFATRTDCVVAVSKAALDASVKRDRLPAGKYRLIPNGVDASLLDPDPLARGQVRQELGFDGSCLVVGNVGTLSVRKDQRTLLQAVRRLVPEIDLRVVIVGSSRPHEIEVERELHALAELPELIGRVLFLQDRHDMHRLFNAFDIYCMPSITEGLSLASIEAMMNGCLVVYSDIEPFRELVTDGQDGLLFRTGDIAHLAQMLRRAAAMPSTERDRMRETARSNSLSAHGIGPMLAAYSRLYRDLALKSPCNVSQPPERGENKAESKLHRA